jgi:hypothetical protein
MCIIKTKAHGAATMQSTKYTLEVGGKTLTAEFNNLTEQAPKIPLSLTP